MFCQESIRVVDSSLQLNLENIGFINIPKRESAARLAYKSSTTYKPWILTHVACVAIPVYVEVADDKKRTGVTHVT